MRKIYYAAVFLLLLGIGMFVYMKYFRVDSFEVLQSSISDILQKNSLKEEIITATERILFVKPVSGDKIYAVSMEGNEVTMVRPFFHIKEGNQIDWRVSERNNTTLLVGQINNSNITKVTFNGKSDDIVYSNYDGVRFFYAVRDRSQTLLPFAIVGTNVKDEVLYKSVP
ncbi:hypothetical protein ACFQ88_03975 [Paenibacillus sp. NPDC056579]|uniref:hypothetical protein n=1 Tax=unclassified Paenibacillus TaxID=185978 RepID=UPI001EF8C958|nr:hypothetical protein [Paenibacillus sp. H1-7]ULL16169.1 hypothetical protein DVH26_17955 [Paenibacillus sp. H1-7]